MKQRYLFANWKMYLDYAESVALCANIAKGISIPEGTTVAVFPTDIALVGVSNALLGTGVLLGAQNTAWVSKGAYTGAVSPHMLKEVGCQYVLVGHSERRHIFGETDEAVRKKIEACLDAGLIPVVCIGETAQEKAEGKREYRLKKQLMTAFEGLLLTDDQVFIAYEPVWAIGTGVACLPADADDVHMFILRELERYTPARVPLLYGGSVSVENVSSYVKYESVSGVLCATAATTPEGFFGLLGVITQLK